MNTDTKIKVLLLGSGGREAAIAWKLSQSPMLDTLYIAPGNGGTADFGTNIDLNPTDFDAVDNATVSLGIDLVVAGNEDPLVAGLRDELIKRANARGSKLLFVGPGADGAALEGSKDFAKHFMQRHNIPTARYFTATPDNIAEAEAFMASLQAPYVLKADGLAAGKGVLIIPTLEEARQALAQMLAGQFGKASSRVVIEQFLSGIECSVFTLCDGAGAYRILPVAKDYKRVGEGDTGPNTGGMGSVSPVPFADDEFMAKVEQRIIRPTVEGLKAEGIDYRGFIFFGLICCEGEPYVIEYNVRMGDPETEVVMPRISSDLLPALVAAAEGSLEGISIEQDPRAAVAVMAVSGGYPGSYRKGLGIRGLDAAAEAATALFHAGTKAVADATVTNGGRVIAAVAMADTIADAADSAYRAVRMIDYEGIYFRSDIARDILALI